MEQQLFIRIRGHVQGPYELERLRALVRRGQLSRMHEVSTDGTVWKQAANFPDLFTSPSIDAVQVLQENRGTNKSSDGEIPDVEAPTSTGRWHYAQNDVQRGPVSFDELKSLLAYGSLDGSDLVWTDGMKEWSPAHTVPGLASTSFRGAGSNQMAAGKVDKEVTRTLSESLPWSRFIACVMYFIGALGVLSGASAIVMGARWNQAGIIASGGFSMLYGMVFLWGGHLLFRYCGDIGRLLRDTSMQRLDALLRSLRRFWIYLSIILIVLLVNAIGVAIWAFSIGISLSG